MIAAVGSLSVVAVVVAALALVRARDRRPAIRGGDDSTSLARSRAEPGPVGAPAQGGREATAHEADVLIAVLGELKSAAVAVGPGLAVTRATSNAYSYGLVHDGALRHAELRDLVADAIASGHSGEAEYELPRGIADTAPRSVFQARATPIGERSALLLVIDRSEARRIDEVRQDFLINVSHELKTPVGAISLLAETLLDAADDATTVRHFAERMRRETERLSRLVHDVIELSRLQTADALTSSELLDVDRLVRDAVDQARWRAEVEHIDLEVGPPTGLRTFGDHDLLVTAVRNLLDNAISYSPPHTAVSVVTRRSEEFVEIAVTDRGHGIPFAQQKRIFERFYRIDPARSRRTGGTGLGLAIVKHVAENHGGEATVRSTPGEGSTFTLRLPPAVGLAGTDPGNGGVAQPMVVEAPVIPTAAVTAPVVATDNGATPATGQAR